jgi:hypothetical protein
LLAIYQLDNKPTFGGCGQKLASVFGLTDSGGGDGFDFVDLHITGECGKAINSR